MLSHRLYLSLIEVRKFMERKLSEKSEIIKLIVDTIDDGIIYIDKERKFKLFNRKAKEITGIIFENSASHPAGKIESGDIVILADNDINNDDGGMNVQDLACINIKEKQISEGDALVACGVYNNPGFKPEYKYIRGNSLTTDFKLVVKYLGFNITSEILVEEKIMRISVNGVAHDLSYINSVGHMVVIDGKTGQVKFFQEKGYTVRKESIAELLHGGSFMAKGNMQEDLDVIGNDIEDVFEYSDLVKKIDDILQGGNQEESSTTIYEINKRPGLCTIFPMRYEGELTGVMLKIKDLSKMEELLKDRNELIVEMEKHSHEFQKIYTDIPAESFNEYVGNSQIMKEVKFLAYKASKMKFNILITGESGTGKSQLASEIHKLYKPNAPFVEVNCSAIAPNLIESELFGYVGGAFTGALSSGKMGFFEQANSGTIFLDEIGELPMEMQVKLLYVLQNKVIYRVGATKPTKVDVRIITATNQDLQKAVQNGTFRQDLYYRINVFPINIPPLRERKSDLYLLITKILDKVCNLYGVEPKLFSGQALNKMVNYNWPGNVRELENIIERAITLCDTKMIYSEHINLEEVKCGLTFKEQVQEAEKEILKRALMENGNDKKAAMQSLEMSKSVFYEKLKKYGVTD